MSTETTTSSQTWLDDDTFLTNHQHRRRAEILLRGARLASVEESDGYDTTEFFHTGEDTEDSVRSGLHLLAALTHAVLALGSEPASSEREGQR